MLMKKEYIMVNLNHVKLYNLKINLITFQIDFNFIVTYIINIFYNDVLFDCTY